MSPEVKLVKLTPSVPLRTGSEAAANVFVSPELPYSVSRERKTAGRCTSANPATFQYTEERSLADAA